MGAEGNSPTPFVDRLVRQAGPDARLVVIGCAGAGKSKALDGLAAHWREHGRPVTRLGGRRGEVDRVGWALDAVLGPVALADLEAGEPGAERRALDHLLAVADDDGVLMIDDGQWLDQLSLRLIAGAAERGRAVVLATRPVSRHDLAALVGRFGADGRTFSLGPLGADEVAHLVESATGKRPEPAVIASLLARSAGNPAWLVRLLAGDDQSSGTGPLRPLEPTSTLVASVRSVLTELSPATRAVVVALAAGATAGDGLLAEVVELPAGAVAVALDQATATGLVVAGTGELVAVVAEALAWLVPAPERLELQDRLASTAVARPGRIDVASRLVAAGATGQATARLLVRTAEEVAAADPNLASRWLTRAVELGAAPDTLSLPRARLAAARGDLGSALGLATVAAEAGDAQTRSEALVLVAGALVARGQWALATERYVSLLGSDEPALALLAVPLLVAGGRLEQAHEVDDAARRRLVAPVSLATEVLCASATAMLATVHCPAEALDTLLEATDLAEADPPILLLADTPHALGVLVASASGDLVVASQLAQRAVDTLTGGAALAVRHRLLAAWVDMRAGRWAAAEEVLRATEATSRRDLLVAVALDAALARRSGDVGRLTAAWERAQPILLGWHAELGLLEPVGELAVAAARLGQWERMAPIARELGAVLDRLGRPPLWDLLLRWYGLQAAIAADDGAAAVRRAEDVARIEPASPRLASLGGIARVWAATLQGRTDAGALRWAASELQTMGLAWEGSRLLGAGAIRSADSAVTRSLLEKARGLRDELGTAGPGGLADVSSLSDRECQVADGVAEGLTHREIGERLFISPKTVEHHVARIRQKLGASTRAEMLAALRTSE